MGHWHKAVTAEQHGILERIVSVAVEAANRRGSIMLRILP